MSDLKPCPLCGSSQVGIYWGDGTNIRCNNCNIHYQPSVNRGFFTEEHVAFGWNNKGLHPDEIEKEIGWVRNEGNVIPSNEFHIKTFDGEILYVQDHGGGDYLDVINDRWVKDVNVEFYMLPPTK